jgi:hypothetical protein
MKNKGLISLLIGITLASCTSQQQIIQTRLSNNSCQDEWTNEMYNQGQIVKKPKNQKGFVSNNITGTKRSKIQGQSQSWETFKAFNKDYYATQDTTAQNPLGFDLTKKDLVAIAYSPVTGKTEARPYRVYHPMQIIDSKGNPHKEVIINNINLKNPEVKGCKINENKINFQNYGIETKVINNQTYLIVEACRESKEEALLDVYAIPLTKDVLLIQDPVRGRLVIQSTKDHLNAYKFVNSTSTNSKK